MVSNYVFYSCDVFIIATLYLRSYEGKWWDFRVNEFHVSFLLKCFFQQARAEALFARWKKISQSNFLEDEKKFNWNIYIQLKFFLSYHRDDFFIHFRRNVNEKKVCNCKSFPISNFRRSECKISMRSWILVWSSNANYNNYLRVQLNHKLKAWGSREMLIN